MLKMKKKFLLIPSHNFINQTDKSQLVYAFAIISFMFLIYYFLFFIFQSKFRFSPIVNKDLLNSFVVPVIGTKGYELYILFIGTNLYLIFSYLIIINSKIFTLFRSKIFQIIVIVPILIKILTTYPKKVADISINLPALSVFLVSLGLIMVISYKARSIIGKLSPALKSTLILTIWLFFTLFTILTIPVLSGSTTDYNFFIAPALKLLDGEQLGSFYIQYGLGEIVLFKYMLTLGLKLHQMQIIQAIIFSFWFLLYYFLALKLFKEKFFVFLFLLSLVLFRFIASPFHPILSPQGNPMRLDLWLPLFLIAIRFKILSPVTSLAFSAAYVLDNFFGLLYFLVYLSAIVALTLLKKLHHKTIQIKKMILILAPVIGSLFFQYRYFGSFFSPSAKLVDALDYWQMNISPHSMYWVSILILGLFLYTILKEKTGNLKANYLLLLGLALVELIYFFGRSHENNFMITSGILLVILFLTFEKLAKLYNLRKTLFSMSGIFILITSLIFSAPIFENLNRVYDHLKRGVLTDINPIDRAIDQDQDFLNNYATKKIYFISNYDAYLNYRYNLKQVGFYNPFIANLFLEDTIKLLIGISKDNYLILWEDSPVFKIENYNKSKLLSDQGLKFELTNGPTLADIKFFELNIVNR